VRKVRVLDDVVSASIGVGERHEGTNRTGECKCQFNIHFGIPIAVVAFVDDRGLISVWESFVASGHPIEISEQGALRLQYHSDAGGVVHVQFIK
jgi:hypothetical protein